MLGTEMFGCPLFGHQSRSDGLPPDISYWYRRWVEEQCELHHLVRGFLKRRYGQVAASSGFYTANCWLRETCDGLWLGKRRLSAASGEEEIDAASERIAEGFARRNRELLQKLDITAAQRSAEYELARLGFQLPPLRCSDVDGTLAMLARLEDATWWRRALRRAGLREVESLLRREGVVHKAGQIYVSTTTLQRRRRQLAANRAFLESIMAENDLGQRYTLAELSDISVANPRNRRIEMMVRCRGLEEFAQRDEVAWSASFVTLTCPSKFHATSQRGVRYAKFSGATPRDGQQYLRQVWSRIRAALQRRGVNVFGLRVAEPHHDGTPHWHLLLWTPEAQHQEALQTVRAYALQEDGGEPGAAERRCVVDRIDPEKGSATGYVAKYISKNIDGFGVGEDSYGRDAVESSTRVEAWASAWGIRQFQFFGAPSVTVWRELRRLSEADCDPGLLRSLQSAADAGDFAEYVRLMGGAGRPLSERPLRPLMITRERPGRYGEAVEALRGLLCGVREIVTRVRRWSFTWAPAVTWSAEAEKAPRAPPLEYCQ
jgi:hypothetical protein